MARKNLRTLGGLPLVARSIAAALAAQLLTDVVLTTDDAEILAVGAGYDIELIERPAELSTDTAVAIDYVVHALDVMDDRGADPYDAIAIVQPTSPLTQGSDIDETLRLLDSSGAGSAVTVMKVDHAIHPTKLKSLDGDRLVPYFEDEAGRMAEHELPTLYVRNGAVYASLVSVIGSGTLLADDCRAVIMPPERSIDINEEIDLAFAEFLLGRHQEPAP